MKLTRTDIMGLPITIWVVDELPNTASNIKAAFGKLAEVDELFSLYKSTSELSKLNKGSLSLEQASHDLRTVLKLCESMRVLTQGYFDHMLPDGQLDPSGLVKGWAVGQAADVLKARAHQRFVIEAGGDRVISGLGENNLPWTAGIRLPAEPSKIAKSLKLQDAAIATSALNERGQHIINPKTGQPAIKLVSSTVVGPDITTADTLATALFASEDHYKDLLVNILPAGYDAYIIQRDGKAIYTDGLAKYFSNQNVPDEPGVSEHPAL